jgi:hypothetical protein
LWCFCVLGLQNTFFFSFRGAFGLPKTNSWSGVLGLQNFFFEFSRRIWAAESLHFLREKSAHFFV